MTGRNRKNGTNGTKPESIKKARKAPPAASIDAASAEPQQTEIMPQTVTEPPEPPLDELVEEEASPDEQVLPKPGTRTPERLIEQRVEYVGSLYVIGTPTGAIRRNVTNAARKERDQRARARADTSKKTAFPVVVWGDVEPSSRTVDRLIDRAKKACQLNGKTLSTAGEMLLGKLMGTLDVAVEMGVRNNDPRVIVHAVETRARILGLQGAVKIQMGGLEGSPPIETRTMETLRVTEEQVHDELAAMRRKAEARRQLALENAAAAAVVIQTGTNGTSK